MWQSTGSTSAVPKTVFTGVTWPTWQLTDFAVTKPPWALMAQMIARLAAGPHAGASGSADASEASPAGTGGSMPSPLLRTGAVTIDKQRVAVALRCGFVAMAARNWLNLSSSAGESWPSSSRPWSFSNARMAWRRAGSSASPDLPAGYPSALRSRSAMATVVGIDGGGACTARAAEAALQARRRSGRWRNGFRGLGARRQRKRQRSPRELCVFMLPPAPGVERPVQKPDGPAFPCRFR